MKPAKTTTHDDNSLLSAAKAVIVAWDDRTDNPALSEAVQRLAAAVYLEEGGKP